MGLIWWPSVFQTVYARFTLVAGLQRPSNRTPNITHSWPLQSEVPNMPSVFHIQWRCSSPIKIQVVFFLVVILPDWESAWGITHWNKGDVRYYDTLGWSGAISLGQKLYEWSCVRWRAYCERFVQCMNCETERDWRRQCLHVRRQCALKGFRIPVALIIHMGSVLRTDTDTKIHGYLNLHGKGSSGSSEPNWSCARVESGGFSKTRRGHTWPTVGLRMLYMARKKLPVPGDNQKWHFYVL